MQTTKLKPCPHCKHLKFGHRPNTQCNPNKLNTGTLKAQLQVQPTPSDKGIQAKLDELNEWWRIKEENTLTAHQPDVTRDTWKKKVYKAEHFLFDKKVIVAKSQVRDLVEEISAHFDIETPRVIFASGYSENQGLSSSTKGYVKFQDSPMLDMQIVLHEMSHQLDRQKTKVRFGGHSLGYVLSYETMIREFRSDEHADKLIANLQDAGVPTTIEEYEKWFDEAYEAKRRKAELDFTSQNKLDTGYILRIEKGYIYDEDGWEGEYFYKYSAKRYVDDYYEAKIYKKRETAEKALAKSHYGYEIEEISIRKRSDGKWEPSPVTTVSS